MIAVQEMPIASRLVGLAVPLPPVVTEQSYPDAAALTTEYVEPVAYSPRVKLAVVVVI
jgi:hypothetical protein